MIKEAILKLVKKEDIGFDMARQVMDEIMTGEASEVQKSAYLTALSMKTAPILPAASPSPTTRPVNSSPIAI